jgi:lipopolysaccharide biosynthesis regulator YciM
VYALHGLLQVAMRQNDWQRALEIAEEAIKLDPSGRSESLLGFFAAQAATPRPDHPGRIEVDQALAASQAEHRRLHSQQFAEL